MKKLLSVFQRVHGDRVYNDISFSRTGQLFNYVSMFGSDFCFVVWYTANVQQVIFPCYVSIPATRGVFFTCYYVSTIYKRGFGAFFDYILHNNITQIKIRVPVSGNFYCPFGGITITAQKPNA